MRYIILLFTLLLFFTACSDDSKTASSPYYLLSYDDSSLNITGEIRMQMDNIPKNHLISISSFIPQMSGCVFSLDSSITPDSITFSSINASNNLTLDLKLIAPCTSNTLKLLAKQTDTSVLDGKIITRNEDVEFTYNISTPTKEQVTLLSDTNSLTVNQASQTTDITISAFNKSNTPVDSGSIKVIYPDEVQNGIDVGQFSPIEGTLDDAKVTFTYTAPHDLEPLFEANITTVDFKFVYDADTSTTLHVEFSKESTFVPKLILSESPLTFTKNSEKRKFSVKVLDENSAPVQNGSVSFIYPETSLNAGTITPAVAQVKEGVADFQFEAPANLNTLSSAVFTFYYNDDKVNSKDLTVYYRLYVPPVTPPDPVPTYKTVTSPSSLTILQNSQVYNINVSVFDSYNVPVNKGKVKIIYPSSVLSGIDVGSFSPSEATVSDGKASFVYTGPSDLASLVNSGNTGSTFQFYYEDDISHRSNLSIIYNPTPGDIIPTSYKILFQPQDGSYEMSLQEKKPFAITIVDKDNNLVADADIHELNISVENIAISSLQDSSGNLSTSLKYTGKNSITATFISNTKSGLAPLHVSGYFRDINGKDILIDDTFNIVIQSGPPTAISFSYIGTSQDTDRAKFIEQFAISVTDRYFNPISTHPNISVGAIVGYALKDKDDYESRIFEDSAVLGTLHADTFDLNQNINLSTTDIDLANDQLATFGNGYVYPASGGWSFDNFDSLTLSLSPGQYDGDDTSDLGYAIGHNLRQDPCILGRKWLGQTKLKDDTTTLDDQGTAVIELSYDYYLTGKDIVLYANIVGQDNQLARELKIGEAQKRTLRGHGIYFDNKTFSTKSTSGESGSFCLWMKDTPEPYRNANFGYDGLSIGDDCASYTLTPIPSPVSSCNSNLGHSCLIVTASAVATKECTVSVSDSWIRSEF
jgi:hypothetical protein